MIFMDLAAYRHRFVSPQQALSEFALIRHFEPAYLARQFSRQPRILVIEQALSLSQAEFDHVQTLSDFLIVRGALNAEGGLNLSQVAQSLGCLLVLGDVSARHLTTAQGAITIEGKLELQRYLHLPKQLSEPVELRVSQRLLVPVYLQENPAMKLHADEFICPYRYQTDDGLANWPSSYFADTSRQQIINPDGLVSHILSEVQKPPELQSNFDWIAHYDFNPRRYPAAETQLVSNAPPQHRAQLPIQLGQTLAPAQAARLHSLEFSDVYAQYLPDWLNTCRNLQQLKLDNCFSYLQHLPDLSALIDLRCLEINGSNPDLQRHPVSATRFVRELMQMRLGRLEYLSINFWNATPAFFANAQSNTRAALNAEDLHGIANFQHLKVINFYGNGLSDLPEEFYTLKHLRYIRILDQLSPACQQRLSQRYAHQAVLQLA